MHVEELPSVKEVVSTLEEARQRVSEADLVGASRSALTSLAKPLPTAGPAVGGRVDGPGSPAPSWA
jgi:hypothetical protein